MEKIKKMKTFREWMKTKEVNPETLSNPELMDKRKEYNAYLWQSKQTDKKAVK